MSSASIITRLVHVDKFAHIASYFTEKDRPSAESTWTHLEALREEVKKDRLEPTEGVLITLHRLNKPDVSVTIPVYGLLKDVCPFALLAISYPFSPAARFVDLKSSNLTQWLEALDATYKDFGVKNIVLVLNLFASR